jgi:hypothetical protein
MRYTRIVTDICRDLLQHSRKPSKIPLPENKGRLCHKVSYLVHDLSISRSFQNNRTHPLLPQPLNQASHSFGFNALVNAPTPRMDQHQGLFEGDAQIVKTVLTSPQEMRRDP